MESPSPIEPLLLEVSFVCSIVNFPGNVNFPDMAQNMVRDSASPHSTFLPHKVTASAKPNSTTMRYDPTDQDLPEAKVVLGMGAGVSVW